VSLKGAIENKYGIHYNLEYIACLGQVRFSADPIARIGGSIPVHVTSKGGFMKRTRLVLTVALALFLALILFSASPAKTTEAAGATYHVVRYGETLSSIARWYHVNVWSLACANGLYNANYIYAGQVLYVPAGAWYGGYGCQPTHYPKYNPPPCYYGCAPQPVYNPPPCYYNCRPPVTNYCYYTVRWGDTLSSIAWRYHTTIYALTKANKIYNPNYIYAGQRLYLPGCKAAYN
jgi:LysM repeat protein